MESTKNKAQNQIRAQGKRSIDRKLASRMFISQRISIHGSKPNKYFDRPPSVRYQIIAKGGPQTTRKE